MAPRSEGDLHRLKPLRDTVRDESQAGPDDQPGQRLRIRYSYGLYSYGLYSYDTI